MKKLGIIFGIIFALLAVGCGKKNNPNPLPVQPRSKVASAPYGLMHPHFPFAAWWNSFEGEPTRQIQILHNTFGVDLERFRLVVQHPGTVGVEIHLVNDVCTRNDRCGRYELLHDMKPGDVDWALRTQHPVFMQKFRQYVKEAAGMYLPLIPKSVRCYVSPLLESNVQADAARVAIAVTKELWGSQCKVVWNPNGENPAKGSYGQDYFEEHGAQPRLGAPCIANLDGKDINLQSRKAVLGNYINHTDVKPYVERYGHCAMVGLWIAEYNGICRGAFVDPRERRCWPSQATINEMGALRKATFD